MSRERPLHGGCACGRNHYTIEVPQNASETAQVIFDRSFGSSLYPNIHSTPLSAWLRVPLTWYHSTTYAFFPDETHPSIRRVYTPPQAPETKRHFCGFCGTPLSFWSESPREEADFISLTLGSLVKDDVRDLGELGLLPNEFAGMENGDGSPPHSGRTTLGNAVATVASEQPARVREGIPWFDSMIEGSKLGKVKVRRGEETKDGRRVEWEIVEWANDREESPSKRKVDDMEQDA